MPTFEEEQPLKKEDVDQERETVNTPEEHITDPVEQKALVNHVSERYDHFVDLRRGKEEEWRTYYNNYRQVLPAQHKWRSKIFDPSTFQQVESIAPRLLEGLVPAPDFFEVRAKDPEQIPAEDEVKTLLKHQLNKADFYEKLVEAIKQALIYGTTFIKIPFREDWDWRYDKIVDFNTDQNPITGRKTKKAERVTTVKNKVRTFYGPDIEVVDIFDMFFDPLEPNTEELIHVSRVSLQHLAQKSREGVYINVDRVVTDADTADSESGDLRHTEVGLNPDEGKRDAVTIKEYWGHFDIDGDGQKEPVVITVANDSVLLRAEPNPFWHGKPPFIISQFIPVPKEVYGIGLPETIASLQNQINEIINQRNDNISLILNRMWKVSTLSQVDLKRLTSAPGRVIMTSDMNGIEPLETPDVTASAYNEVTVLKQQVEQATGFSRFAAGLEQGRSTPRAARTVMAFQQASLAKFGMTVQFMEKKLLVPLLEMFLALDQQFLEDIEYIRVLGSKSDIFEVDPNDIRGEYSFVALGASEMMNKESKLQGLMTFLSIVQNDPTVDRGVINEKIWQLLGNREPLPRIEQPPIPGGQPGETQGGQMLNNGTIQPNTPPIPGGGLG